MDHRHQEFLGYPEFSGDPEMSREAGISLLMYQDRGPTPLLKVLLWPSDYSFAWTCLPV